jgi:hypothetical protein
MFPSASSFGHWNRTNSNIESGREAREFIAIVTEGASLFITIIPRTPYLLALSKTSFKEQDGPKMISNALV